MAACKHRKAMGSLGAAKARILCAVDAWLIACSYVLLGNVYPSKSSLWAGTGVNWILNQCD